MSDVVLTINGSNYGGWDSYRITRSIEQLSGSFNLTVTDRWAGGRQSWPIKTGDHCIVTDGDDQLIDGYVDDRSVSYDASSHTISIAGRDRTGDLVDCSSIIKQTKGQTLKQIAQDACLPFGIDVVSDANVGSVFEHEYAEPGQTVFDLLTTLARHRGVLLTSDGQGRLLITSEKSTASGGSLTFGQNIKACQGRDSMRDRFSDYTALYQTPQTDHFSGQSATEQTAAAVDAGARSPRPLIMLVDEGGDLEATVKHERNVRSGKSRSIIYTVSDIFNASGQRWQPNTRVTVTDPNQSPALNNTSMLITACTYIRDAGGTRTELNLVMPGTFDLLAAPEPVAAGALF